MDERKLTIFHHMLPPDWKTEFKELRTMSVSELATWTIQLKEKNDSGIPIDPAALEGFQKELDLRNAVLPGEESPEVREANAARVRDSEEAVEVAIAVRKVNEAVIIRLFGRRSPSTSAPKVGWTILAIVCDREDLERSAGDLEEWYPIYLAERGRLATNIWYWAQITRTVMSRLWPAVERGLKLAELFSKVRSG